MECVSEVKVNTDVCRSLYKHHDAVSGSVEKRRIISRGVRRSETQGKAVKVKGDQ